jgi:hypothetical protein
MTSRVLQSVGLLGRRSCLFTSQVCFVPSVRFLTTLKPVIPDPERPKKPSTAWLLFLADFRQQMKDKNAVLKPKEVFVAASTEWKAIPSERKQKYDDVYKQEKAVYEERFKEYVTSGKKDAWKSDPERPKKPLTAYFRFLQDFRAQNPNPSISETAKAASTAWKALAKEKRTQYNKEYATAKAKYQKDLEAYKASGKEHAWKSKVGIAQVEEKLIAAKKKAQEKAIREKMRLKKAKLLVKAKQLEQAKLKKQKEKERAKKLKLLAAKK